MPREQKQLLQPSPAGHVVPLAHTPPLGRRQSLGVGNGTSTPASTTGDGSQGPGREYGRAGHDELP